MASHRRQGLGAPPLERGTAAHAHQPSNGTLRFSPYSGLGIARGAQGHVLARHFQNTFAHTSAALCMPHAMLDVGQHRPGLLAQCVMHRADSCVDEAHYIEVHDAWNEAYELRSRLSPQ